MTHALETAAEVVADLPVVEEYRTAMYAESEAPGEESSSSQCRLPMKSRRGRLNPNGHDNPMTRTIQNVLPHVQWALRRGLFIRRDLVQCVGPNIHHGHECLPP